MSQVLDASVIIPTRNRPILLRAALRSVLADPSDRIEVIVVDDGSMPPVQDGLLQDFGTDPRLTVLRHNGPNGAAAARNLGAERARGKVLFFLDDDDQMLPGYCNEVLVAMAGRDLPWGFSSILHHGKGGPAPFRKRDGVSLVEHLPPLGRKHLTGLGCGFWVQTALFRTLGGLDVEFHVNEDTEFCLRLLSNGHHPWISEDPGVSVLRHGPGVSGEEGSVTRRTHATQRALYFAKIVERYQTVLTAAPAAKRFLVRRYLKTLAKTGPLDAGIEAATRYRIAGARRYFLMNWLLYRLIRH